MTEWVPIRVDLNALGYVRPLPDPAVWRAWVVETFGANWYWDVCASCGGPIRPPEQFYVHESSREVAHVRQCWDTTGDDTA